MAELKIIIRDYTSKKPQSICLKYYFGKDTLLYTTKLRILPSYWDQEKQRVKNTKYCTDKDDINSTLSDIENSINQFFIKSIQKGITVNKVSLKRFLDSYFGKTKEHAGDFHGFFELFIEQNKTRVNPKNGQIINYKTIREYERTFILIKEYEAKRNTYLEFESIDLDFYSDFTSYLQSINLATNTIGHKIGAIISVLNAATERGLNKNQSYKSESFKAIKEESESIALSEDELQKIFEFDFSENKRLERTRDLFLVGCWTGLRFSDFTRIKKEYINDGILIIEQHKTGARVAIPIHPVFLSIWKKYKKNLPENISNQKFNDYIKEVCEIVGIDSVVYKSITKGGKRETTQYKKWEMVSSHTARRSFATNLYKSGFPSYSIMQITGHKTEAAFLKYIKVTKEEHAKLLMDHWNKKLQ